MDGSVTRLFPCAGETHPVCGLYLLHRLRDSRRSSAPFVYTNFVTSLDGRISEPDPATGLRGVPAAIANAHDQRLYMELLAQCDVVLTTARHLRAVAAGRHADLLTIPEDEHSDLTKWRRQRGLPQQPGWAVVSSDLRFPAAAFPDHHQGPFLVLTTNQAPHQRIRELEELGIKVLRAGEATRLEGRGIVDTLSRDGFTIIYSVAGPKVLHTLLQADVVDRVYLTIVQKVLGGAEYDTLCNGAPLIPPRGFDLHELYLDNALPQNAGLASFDRQPVP